MERTDRDITLTGTDDIFDSFSIQSNTAYIHIDYDLDSDATMHIESTYGGSGKWTKLEDSEIIVESSDDSLGVNIDNFFPEEVLLRVVFNNATGTINSITYKS